AGAYALLAAKALLGTAGARLAAGRTLKMQPEDDFRPTLDRRHTLTNLAIWALVISIALGGIIFAGSLYRHSSHKFDSCASDVGLDGVTRKQCHFLDGGFGPTIQPLRDVAILEVRRRGLV